MSAASTIITCWAILWEAPRERSSTTIRDSHIVWQVFLNRNKSRCARGTLSIYQSRHYPSHPSNGPQHTAFITIPQRGPINKNTHFSHKNVRSLPNSIKGNSYLLWCLSASWIRAGGRSLRRKKHITFASTLPEAVLFNSSMRRIWYGDVDDVSK